MIVETTNSRISLVKTYSDPKYETCTSICSSDSGISLEHSSVSASRGQASVDINIQIPKEDEREREIQSQDNLDISGETNLLTSSPGM